MAKYKMYLAEQTTTWKYYGDVIIDTDDIPALDGMSEYETKKHLSEHCGEYDLTNEHDELYTLRETLDNKPESTTQSTTVSHYIVLNVD